VQDILWPAELYFDIINSCITLYLYNRISGGLASNKNIHGTVSEQIQKNWAKLKWKVRIIIIMLSNELCMHHTYHPIESGTYCPSHPKNAAWWRAGHCFVSNSLIRIVTAIIIL
jgi:hypothetical protein